MVALRLGFSATSANVGTARQCGRERGHEHDVVVMLPLLAQHVGPVLAYDLQVVAVACHWSATMTRPEMAIRLDQTD
jgi:hypothetical protein